MTHFFVFNHIISLFLRSSVIKNKNISLHNSDLCYIMYSLYFQNENTIFKHIQLKYQTTAQLRLNNIKWSPSFLAAPSTLFSFRFSTCYGDERFLIFISTNVHLICVCQMHFMCTIKRFICVFNHNCSFESTMFQLFGTTFFREAWFHSWNVWQDKC